MTSHGLETSVLSDVMLPLALAVIMFGMGTSLKVADFARLRQAPRGVAAGLTGQLVILPVLGALVATLFVVRFGLSTPLALGILVLAAAPGGATSNLLTYLARGDHALSIVLTSIVSLASFVTVPVILYTSTWALFGDPRLVQVDPVSLVVLVLGIVALPVVGGMAVAAKWPRQAARADRPVRIFGALFLALLIAGVIYENRAGFWGFARQTVPAALVLNGLALGTGLYLGRAALLNGRERRAIAIEVGFQNGTLGIVIAVSQLGSAQAALVPGFYSLVMFVTGGLLALWWARRDAAARPRPGPDGVDFDVVIEEIVQAKATPAARSTQPGP